MAGVTLFLIVGLLFGCLMLAIGFLGGFCLATRNNSPAVLPTCDNAAPHDQLAVQRVRMISHSLLRLTEHMAGNVTAHSTKIKAISAGLRGAAPTLLEGPACLVSVPEQILAANFELQQQLAKAKQHMEKQAVQLRALESEARTDALTTLLNRRAFDEEMRKQLSVSDRKSTPLALLMLDIDQFKKLNDTHGHQVGDEVLCEVAHVIVQQLREMDMAFRHGGEEFAVLLPATNSKDAGIVAERIRSAIEHSIVSNSEKQLNVTVSIGVATVVASDHTEQIFRRADEALYSAKKAGRNCVYCHTGGAILQLDNSAPKKGSVPIGEQQSPATSIVSLNRELTRHVCESRRLKRPLSLVCVRLEKHDTNDDGVSTEDPEGRLLPGLIESFRQQLQECDLVTPISGAEFIVVLSGRTQSAAIALTENVMNSDGHKVPGAQVHYTALELFPKETAEQLLLRARESVLLASAY